MSPHLKKLIGTVATLVWLAVYSLIAMAIGVRVLPGAGGLATFLYYLAAGTAWALPVGFLLPWMHSTPRRRDP